MQFTTFALTTLLPALALGTRLYQNGNSTPNNDPLATSKSVVTTNDHCDSTGNAAKGDGGSTGAGPQDNCCGLATVQPSDPRHVPRALAADCNNLVGNLATATTYKSDKNGGSVVHSGTCSFYVYPRNGASEFDFGNSDVSDLLTDVIDKYSDGTLVAGEGTMYAFANAQGNTGCDGAGAQSGNRVDVYFYVAATGAFDSN